MKRKFTSQVRDLLHVARREAAKLGHDSVGTNHLLFALLFQNEGVAAVALLKAVRGDDRRGSFNDLRKRGSGVLSAGLRFESSVRTVLLFAGVESLRLGHCYVGPEHVLLALLRLEDENVLGMLAWHQIEADSVRDAVLRQLGAIAPDDAGESVSGPLPALDEMPSLPELLEQRRNEIAELRSEAAMLWSELSAPEPASPLRFLESSLLELQERGTRSNSQLLLGRRVIALEQEINTISAQKSTAADAGDYQSALALRARENDLRVRFRESSDALRRLWVLQERLARVTEQRSEALRSRNLARAAGLKTSEALLRQAIASAEAVWAEFVPTLPELTPDVAEEPPPPPEPARRNQMIFISYHRADDAGHVTGRIYDRLVSEFGPNVVFKDVDSIPLGVDFRRYLEDAVGSCAVLLAIVGVEWRQKMQNPRDFVRIELEAALRHSIPIIPLFLQSEAMPAEEELPPSLQPLAHRNGSRIRPDPDFTRDMRRVISAIRHLTGSAGLIEGGPSAPPSASLTWRRT